MGAAHHAAAAAADRRLDAAFSSLSVLPVAPRSLKLKAFGKFENTTDAMQAVTGIVEGKMPKNLKKFLSDEISEQDMKKEKLIVGDAKLGGYEKRGPASWTDSSRTERRQYEGKSFYVYRGLNDLRGAQGFYCFRFPD